MITGGSTPFNDIRLLQHHATSQAREDVQPPNVTWGRHNEEDVLNVDGLMVPLSGWKKLYTETIEKIKVDLKSVTFSLELPLPAQEDCVENICGDLPGVNFATALPVQFRESHKQYLLRHVRSTKELRDRFVLSTPDTGASYSHRNSTPSTQWNAVAAKKWMSHVDELIRSLCVLGFLASGPGGRGEEWASMLAMNEQNGLRSVFCTMKGLCFMTGYSKVIQSLLHAQCLIPFTRRITSLVMSVIFHTFPLSHIPSSFPSTFSTFAHSMNSWPSKLREKQRIAKSCSASGAKTALKLRGSSSVQ